MTDRVDYYFGLIGSMLAGRDADATQRSLIYDQLRERIRTRIAERDLGDEMLRGELSAFESAVHRTEAAMPEADHDALDALAAGPDEPISPVPPATPGPAAVAAARQRLEHRRHDAPPPQRRGLGVLAVAAVALIAFLAGAMVAALFPAPAGLGYRHPVFDAMADEIGRHDLSRDTDYLAVLAIRDALDSWHSSNGSYPATPEGRPVLIGQMQGEPFATFMQVKANRDAAARLTYMSDGTDYKATLAIPARCHVYLVRAPDLADPARTAADGATCRAIAAWTSGARDW